MINYEDLYEQYGDHIPYSLLLSTKEWVEKRKLILSRDKDRCQKCEKNNIYYVGVELNDEKLYTRSRDGVTLPVYHRGGVTLQVHHKYYVLNNSNDKVFNLPWNYEDDCFITVCVDCHKKIHDEVKIPIYIGDQENEELDLKGFTFCKRCDGFGRLPQYYYVSNGICFKCNGLRYEEFTQERKSQNTSK